ncbi:MAG: hypothetical protein AAGN82_01355 [Myxococcota bacterium]
MPTGADHGGLGAAVAAGGVTVVAGAEALAAAAAAAADDDDGGASRSVDDEGAGEGGTDVDPGAGAAVAVSSQSAPSEQGAQGPSSAAMSDASRDSGAPVVGSLRAAAPSSPTVAAVPVVGPSVGPSGVGPEAPAPEQAEAVRTTAANAVGTDRFDTRGELPRWSPLAMLAA